MKIFPLYSFIGLAIASLAQTDLVHGFSEIPGESLAKKIPSAAAEPELPIEALRCPQPSIISPCTCILDFYGVDIKCSGSAVSNQMTIETALREIRRVNEIPADRGIHINQFTVQLTALTQLDLAPFYGSRMLFLSIEGNFNLAKLVTSGNTGDHGSIHAEYLGLGASPLNRKGLGDTLKYFSNKMNAFYAYNLDLKDVNVNGSEESESEILPGLSLLTNLDHLSLNSCKIPRRLDSRSWNFKGFQKLSWLNLQYNNINEIGENFFHLETDHNSLYIRLMGNQLNETSFHPNSGIAQTGRKTTLKLSSNQLTTLPAPIFETFLDAHSENFLIIEGNPLICDERLSWIKSRREEFQSRLDGADCSNDKDHTIFDSHLIP